jgi:hypothetical protein
VSVVLMRVKYTVGDDLRWHEIHIKIYDDRFKHSSNIKVIATTICKASVLVLLMGVVHDTCLRWHNLQSTFQDYPFRNSSNIKVIT